MNIRNLTPLGFKEFDGKTVHAKRMVDVEAVKNVIRDFMYQGYFIAEVELGEEERMNLSNVYKAFKYCIKENHVKAGVFLRQDRIFLRNDTVPLSDAERYPKSIVDASKKNRMNF